MMQHQEQRDDRVAARYIFCPEKGVEAVSTLLALNGYETQVERLPVKYEGQDWVDCRVYVSRDGLRLKGYAQFVVVERLLCEAGYLNAVCCSRPAEGYREVMDLDGIICIEQYVTLAEARHLMADDKEWSNYGAWVMLTAEEVSALPEQDRKYASEYWLARCKT
jgi:hypothetical protein